MPTELGLLARRVFVVDAAMKTEEGASEVTNM